MQNDDEAHKSLFYVFRMIENMEENCEGRKTILHSKKNLNLKRPNEQ
jgi:hypothetical protein